MNRSKVAVVASSALGKIASVVGYVLGVCSLLIIFIGFSDLDANGAVAAVILLSFVFAFSVFLVAKGIQIKQRIKRFKRYVSLISNQQMTSLDNIATEVVKSVKYVSDDLQMMIRRKFFANATINSATNEIIIGGAQGAGSTLREMEVYICSGCGASGAKPKGEAVRCEYCGSAVV